MAGNDGATTELFTGWSSLVHQPEDEPEESELPSTVDIGALTAEAPMAPSQTQHEVESDSEDSEGDSSNSDGSESQDCCSHSDSSDSSSSSSSAESSSRSASPEFSVTSSQTNGLRLTIATVRKSPVTTIKENTDKKSTSSSSSSSSSNCSSDSDDSNDDSDDDSSRKKPLKPTGRVTPKRDLINPRLKQQVVPSKSRPNCGMMRPKSNCASNCRDAVKARVIRDKSSSRDSSLNNRSNNKAIGNLTNVSNNRSNDAALSKLRSSSNNVSNIKCKDSNKLRNISNRLKVDKRELNGNHPIKDKTKEESSKVTEAKMGRKKLRLKKKAKKLASLPLSRSSNYSSSETDSSDDLLPASCSLQEIRQEDLAAILPDQNECNDFNDFGHNNKESPATGDLSESDMELPQQAINSLIQRTTESSSDEECHQLPNPQTLFANSLLQQFVPNNSLVNPLGDGSTTSIGDSMKSVSGSSSIGQSSAKSLGDGQCEIAKTGISIDIPGSKRGRGRPRRVRKHKNDDLKPVNKSLQDFCGAPNVSPDSGIQNSPDHVSSPEPLSLSPSLKRSSQSRDMLRKLDGKSQRSKVVDQRNFSGERHSQRLERQQRNASQEKSEDRSTRRTKSQEQERGKLSSQTSTRRSSHVSKSMPLKTHSELSYDKRSSRHSSQEKLSSSSRNSSLEKVKEPTKPVSFDRIIYANVDRVLYPPRRKAGRPPIKKLGRPTKHSRKENVDMKIASNKNAISSKTGKLGTKLPSINNSKPLQTKNKSTSLKVDKILHSKHTHKHKKRKFRILKPSVSSDPKLNQEIDKLIVEFVRQCSISPKQTKEVVPESVKTLKKVTKKRRTTDYMEKKKKKQNVGATEDKPPNCNEQRLPLKKRHYHIASNNTESHKAEEEADEEMVEDGKGKPEKKEKCKENKVAPKVAPKNNLNNNEYEVKTEKIDEIDLPTTPQSNVLDDKSASSKVEELNPESKSVTATTPKKRHRLESLKAENDAISEGVPEVKSEISANNLEEKFDNVKPSITVESFINELKIKRNLIGQKDDDQEDKIQSLEETGIKKETSTVLPVEKTIAVSPESTKKKVRKRRSYNRTGFPTVKKKKKKPSIEIAETSLEQPKVAEKVTICDRVPKEGEEITKFLQRTSANSSMQDLTTIDADMKSPEISDCECLPEDERIDSDLDECISSRSESVMSVKSDSKLKVDGDNETLSLLESSIERLKSRLEQKKRKRDSKCVVETTNTYPKRRRRDDSSPASSIEPLLENRLRDSASASGDELSKKQKKSYKWRKRYLVAGLFSDYYKEDERLECKTRNLVYNPEEHPFGLMPPPKHCGKYLRTRQTDFKLPYDLWWQHTHSQLPGRDLVPSWNYRKIRTNIYNVKSNGGACEPQTCNCKSTSNCGDDCINRLVLAECPTSHRCLNQRIQKHDWAPGIEKFMTEEKGWGVRTREPIKHGEFILEYLGEVVSDQEFKERMNSIYVNDTHHYCLHLESGLVIDGHRMGGDGRFVNHSCEPNCEIQKWSVNGQFRMALFALRDIKPYEELSYDYNFSLFNPAEGQPCKCRSDHCRGVIGGKTQRVRPDTAAQPKIPGRVGRPRKTEAKKKLNTCKENAPMTNPHPSQQPVPQIQVKPMSHQQKCFILEHHCFLLRNLTKVRKVRDRSQSVSSSTTQNAAAPTNTSAFASQLNALENPRNIKTRKTTQAEDDPELNKAIKLATILKSILLEITTVKGENDEVLSNHIMQLPSKRKLPEFYQKVQDPIDLTTIEQNVATGVYKTPDAFDEDMTKLFSGLAKFYDRTSEVGIAVAKLKKLYTEKKQQSLIKFQDVLGERPPLTFVSKKKNTEEEEDIIRCICGIPRDEGLMIQCERCMVWQHIECVKADADMASYHCEVCVPRKVDYEIPMDDFTEHGHRYYMTLQRGSLQLRQGDTVYVLRDIPIPGTDKKHTYETVGKIDYTELDIFRIERLWKDKDTGKRLAYGHHYLRPHETFHEPTRKFFPNEVMRVPLYEAVPVELIMERCWVMDINTFCKGRPVGSQEDHVYICEYRVDKGAKMFSKVAKSKFPICTKNFAFERFETRLKISRTYCPHDVDESLLKNGGVGRKKLEKEKPIMKETLLQIQPTAPPIQRTRIEQKARLNKILLNLLSKIPTKQVVDISYLLEGGRRRKKLESTKQSC